MKYKACQLALPLLFILLTSLPGYAHKIRVFAWEEGGFIKMEVKFSGGRVAKNATITVASKQSHQELLTGTTDSQGKFSFPIPQTAKENKYDLEIIANSGDGHKNSWLLNAWEYLDLPEDMKQDQPDPQPPSLQQDLPQVTPAYVMNEERLNQIIESALDKKLAPIKRSLAIQQDKKPSFQDILGGIGYILGLAGVAAYFKSNQLLKSTSSVRDQTIQHTDV